VASGAGALGLIAGQGELPLCMAASARRQGRRVKAIAFPGLTDPRLDAAADVTWLQPGEVGAALESLRTAGVREAVLAGKVPKAGLVQGAPELRPDAEALRLLARLRDRRDDSILSALADFLGERGIELLPQAALVPELLAEVGVLGAVAPSEAQRADVAFGLPLARAVAGLDVGQTVVVKGRAVLAVEAIEGTDATIRRAGGIAAGACVVKVAKPRQDPRFDVPAVGPDTLAAMLEAKAAVLAVEAGRTLVLDREALVEAADASSIALLGVSGNGDAAEEPR
jgi:DUF1009 family protein